MRKKELIQKIAEDTGLTNTSVRITIESLLKIATDTLNNGEEVRFYKFGVLSPWKQAGRLARNAKSGTPVTIAPRVSVKFRPGTLLMETLNE